MKLDIGKREQYPLLKSIHTHLFNFHFATFQFLVTESEAELSSTQNLPTGVAASSKKFNYRSQTYVRCISVLVSK